MQDNEITEELEKGGCVRCGKSSKNGGSGGRCSSCLKKLSSDKKKPGHWQRAQTQADSALRRQDGKNGTASHKSSGRGDRKSIMKQMTSAEKKTGQKLSADRKDNAKGYEASNTRAVPEKLNRGRHKVDGKKLSEWKKKLKKHNLELDDLSTLLAARAHAAGNQDMGDVLEMLSLTKILESIINE